MKNNLIAMAVGNLGQMFILHLSNPTFNPFIMCLKPFIAIIGICISIPLLAQKPRYTPKALVQHLDTSEFKILHPQTGFTRSYVETNIELYDIDDDNTTFVMSRGRFMICFEGQSKDGKRYGMYSAYVIDSADHNKRYKIYDQQYEGDNINGTVKIYTLAGTLYSVLEYAVNNEKKSERNYWIDGKSLMNDRKFLGAGDKYIETSYYKNGRVSNISQYSGGAKNGVAKAYYETGVIQDSLTFKNDMPDGLRRYYYPNGQVWIEEIYKDGKDWTVVANYTDKGKKRDAGTLREGNGTVIFYEEDGTVREVKTYVNGVAKD